MQTPSVKLSARDRLIVALDVATDREAADLARQLAGSVGWLKIGLELFTRYGPPILETLGQFAVPVFLDCKLHDIPNTVAAASKQLAGQKLAMFNLHATGGSKMMRAAVQSVHEEAEKLHLTPPKLIAVTLLTSLSESMLREELNWQIEVEDTVVRLAKLARDAGLDGVVASAQEAQRIKATCGESFLVVTPGIRPEWSGSDDQARIVTPRQAIANGADYIVVGRPITRSEKPREAAARIIADMEASG